MYQQLGTQVQQIMKKIKNNKGLNTSSIVGIILVKSFHE